MYVRGAWNIGMMKMSKQDLFAGLGVLALAVALGIPGFAQGGMGPSGFGGPRGSGGPGMMASRPSSPAGGPVSLERSGLGERDDTAAWRR